MGHGILKPVWSQLTKLIVEHAKMASLYQT
jgi:hypothetical protein